VEAGGSNASLLATHLQAQDGRYTECPRWENHQLQMPQVRRIAATRDKLASNTKGDAMTDDNPALENRFALFIDFLGSSNAATGWPRERVHDLVDLLIAVAQTRSAEAISGAAQEDGSYKISITPEVTTFSDLVLISYPDKTSDEAPVLDSMWADIVCQDSIRILAGVAEMALRIGVVIRGGLSFGQLYHENGVAFGEALVDAHRLESEVAGNPRVVISERVLRRITHEPLERLGSYLRDYDGLWHLNYFDRLARQAAPDAASAPSQACRWKEAHLATIDREIKSLPCKQAEKWIWFKERFEAATTRSLFQPE
jgi:hypothetical protein